MSSKLGRTKKTLIGASVALGSFGIGGAAFAVVNGGTAQAAGASSTAGTTNPHATALQIRKFLLRHTVHATLTERTKSGFETVNLIRGTVSTYAGGSITVTAADNSSVTATITAQTKFRNTSAGTLGTNQKVAMVAIGSDARLIVAPKSSSSTAG
jgi:hypothetical protein